MLRGNSKTSTQVILSPLVARGAKRREGKFWRYFPAFRPVVVCVAFRAARLGAIETWCVAGLADCNSRQQDVFCIRAGNSVLVPADTGEATMSVMIELSMRHPSHRRVLRFHSRQRMAR